MSPAQSRLRIEPLDLWFGLPEQACKPIKRAITETYIYIRPEEIPLDERQCAKTYVLPY